MCGRFARRSTQKVLAGWFGVEMEDMPQFDSGFAPTFNAAPQSIQLIVRLSRDTGKREFALARWGLVPFWAKDAKFGYSTFNARAEEVVAKPAYREAFKKRRCLVPADAFYEWQKLDAKTKRPFAIALRSGEPYAFAGLWESWKPKDAEPLETFTIVTTDPNAVTEKLHDRMPVILETTTAGLKPAIPRGLPLICSAPIPPKRCTRGPSATASATSTTTIPICSPRPNRSRKAPAFLTEFRRPTRQSPRIYLTLIRFRIFLLANRLLHGYSVRPPPTWRIRAFLRPGSR